MSACLL